MNRKFDFIPDSVKNVKPVHIDLNKHDLGFADIFRNFNKEYPKTSILRNKIASGDTIMMILCTSEYLEPLDGFIIIITNSKTPIDILSRNYQIFCVDEGDLGDEEDINYIIKRLSVFMYKFVKNEIKDFDNFFYKHVYDEFEMISKYK